MKRFAFATLFAMALFAMGFVVIFQVSGQHHKGGNGGSDDHDTVNNATVSFGGWMTTPAIDRFANNANTQFPRASNHHALTPRIATIRAGGVVNFIVGGFHVVTVYDNGTQPADINTTILVPGPRPGPPIIDDPNHRIYRGLDPNLLPAIVAQDRVETVQFDRPGTYLVICAVLPHFRDGMTGFVRVLPADNDDVAGK